MKKEILIGGALLLLVMISMTLIVWSDMEARCVVCHRPGDCFCNKCVEKMHDEFYKKTIKN